MNPGDTATPVAPIRDRPWWLRETVTLPTLVFAVYFVAGMVHLASTWVPVGDWAVAELIVRHTGRVVPLSGPYSAQRGYDHPLPLVYALQWLPYQLSGGRSSSGLATTIWWNGACLAVMVWLLARARATWLGILALAAVAVTAATVAPGVLITPWNPNLGLVSGVLLVFVVWLVTQGHARLLPLAAGLAVWSTGAHLGFAPFAIALGLTAAAALVVPAVRRGGLVALRPLLGPFVLAGAVALVLVSPMLVDLVSDGGASNPVQIVEGNRPDPSQPTVPAVQGLKVLAAELAIPPAWATSTPPYQVYLEDPAPRPPLLLLVGAVVAIAAYRRRATDELAGLAVGSLGLLAATVALFNVTDTGLQPWYLFPAHASSIALTSLIVWSAGRSIRDAAARRTQWVPGARAPALRLAAAPVAALACALLAVPTLRVPEHEQVVAEQVEAAARLVAARLSPGQRIVVDGAISYDGYYAPGLVLALDRAGFDVRVPDDELYLYSDSMAAPPDWSGTTLLVWLSKGEASPPIAGAELVASTPIPELVFTDNDLLSVWRLPDAG